MQATEGKIGRIFILRLEDGDTIPDCIENFALNNDIRNGYVNFTAGFKSGSIQTHPDQPEAAIQEPHAGAAQGLISRNTEDRPVLQIHSICSRDDHTISGYLHTGADINITGEVIIYEILDAACSRVTDEATGLQLLQVRERPAESITESHAASSVSHHESPLALNDGYSHIIHLFNSSVN